MTINNDIQEAYCSFEVSKLLKEKGFKRYTSMWYDENGDTVLWGDIMGDQDDIDNHIASPTHALAIEWVRVNFGIWIQIHGWTNQPVDDELWKEAYQAFVNGDAMDVSIFKTPQEATEAALLYTLQNLI